MAASLAAFVRAQSTVSGTVRLTDINRNTYPPKLDYANVAVWLDPFPPRLTRQPVRKHSVMLQKDKRFTPHLLIIECGTTVDFPNKDLIFHNAFSNFDGQLFDIGLYPPGTSRSVVFDRPGIVRVFCNIHSSMSAIIVVVDSPYFTTTLNDGRFFIRDVSQGDYVLHFFDERALPDTLAHLSRTLTVGADALSVGTVSISEAGYLPSSHKNKYGRDYPSNPSIAPEYGVERR